MTTTTKTAPVLEIKTIQPIAHNARHGTAKDLFTIWFGTNIMILTMLTGSLAYSLFKLPFWTSIIALSIGNLAGAIFMALHSAQGPKLGVPQMVQTRGQFGSYGSLFVVLLVVFMYLGFFASNVVVGGQTLNAIMPSAINVNSGIVIAGIVSLIAAIFGYKIIHLYARMISYLSGIALLVIFALILFSGRLPDNFFHIGTSTFSGFLGTVSLGALWQLAYAPYVSDYSRYMPFETGSKTAFWASYWGCTLGSTLPMILGVVVAIGFAGDLVPGILDLCNHNPLAIAAIIIFTVSIACSNAMNLYCGTMSTITCIQSIFPKFNPEAKERFITCTVLYLITLAIATWGKDNFLVNYSNFIFMLLYVLVPWTAINLVDYYLVHHGDYDVPSFFLRDGGIYGYFNWTALISYIIGILVEIPFMSTALYTGSIAAKMDGADISWLVGLVVVAPIYYFLITRHNATKTPLAMGE